MNRNLRLRPLAYSAERPEPGSVSAVAIEFAGSWGCRRATAVVEGARGQRCVRSCSCCSEHFSFDECWLECLLTHNFKRSVFFLGT